MFKQWKGIRGFAMALAIAGGLASQLAFVTDANAAKNNRTRCQAPLSQPGQAVVAPPAAQAAVAPPAAQAVSCRASKAPRR